MELFDLQDVRGRTWHITNVRLIVPHLNEDIQKEFEATVIFRKGKILTDDSLNDFFAHNSPVELVGNIMMVGDEPWRITPIEHGFTMERIQYWNKRELRQTITLKN